LPITTAEIISENKRQQQQQKNKKDDISSEISGAVGEHEKKNVSNSCTLNLKNF
jgi:hypothetical protein